MDNILLAGGCSYTDPNFKSLDKSLPDHLNGGWPMWPDHIGTQLGLNVINNARSGDDNLTIHNHIIKGLLKYRNDVKLVCVLWTGFERFRFMHTSTLQLLHQLSRAVIPDHMNNLPADPKNMITDTGFRDWLKSYAMSKYWNPQQILINAINDSMTYMGSIAQLCESMKIPYIFYQGVVPIHFERISKINVFPQNIKNDILTETLKLEIFQHLEKRKSNLIGYPFFSELGGSYLDNENFRTTGDFMAVSKADYHPNSHGQRKISNIFLKKYEELNETAY